MKNAQRALSFHSNRSLEIEQHKSKQGYLMDLSTVLLVLLSQIRNLGTQFTNF